MTIEIKHTLPPDEAKQRLGALIESYKTRYSGQIEAFDQRWEGHKAHLSGKAKGFSLAGTVDVRPSAVVVDLKVPLLLRAFSGKIRELVEDNVKEALG